MSESVAKRLIEFVHDHYATNEFIPLHAPVFRGREQELVAATIESTFVSSVGSYVGEFEQGIARFTGSPAATATVTGTAALHTALVMAGVEPGDLVITQPLSFIATCNAVHYCGAAPVFVDIERETLGLSPKAVEEWLDENAGLDAFGRCYHKQTKRIIRACLPMHTFGLPADLDGLSSISAKWNLALVEDAAESLGSLYKDQHTGTLGDFGTLSFNGNKIITTGGGGMVLSNQECAKRAKYLTTTAREPNTYGYIHNEIGYNYRLPNLNAALGVAQLEELPSYLEEKRTLASAYEVLLRDSELEFVKEPPRTKSNYWLNAAICPDQEVRDHLLEATNQAHVMTRPCWELLSVLPPYEDSISGRLSIARDLSAKLINLPSGIRSHT